MKTNKKAISVIIIIIILWLLIGFTNISIAENVPLSEEGLEKIGQNKIRLESGIGVMVFDLSESKDVLSGDGYLTVSNTYNFSVTIECRVITQLSPVDKDESGNPRIHPKISDFIIFYPLPDISWITLEDEKAVINPFSVYNFRYKINIPVDGNINFRNDSGYLIYINVRKIKDDVSGAHIGIDYSYKLFIIFQGKLKQPMFFQSWMYLIPIPIIIGGTIFIFHKKKHKKTNVKTVDKTIDYAEDNISKSKPVNNDSKDNALQKKIDYLLAKKDEKNKTRGEP